MAKSDYPSAEKGRFDLGDTKKDVAGRMAVPRA